MERVIGEGIKFGTHNPNAVICEHLIVLAYVQGLLGPTRIGTFPGNAYCAGKDRLVREPFPVSFYMFVHF